MKALITVATREERFECPQEENIKTVITGVGKACAAYRLTKAVCEYSPDIVLNIGSAGTANYNVGDIIVASRFADRDLKPLKIEGVESEIDLQRSLDIPSIINGGESRKEFTANTGDDFVTASQSVEGDVIDMESFAEAMVCDAEGIPFVAVKYITDKVGHNSVKLWSDKLKDARLALSEYFAKYILPLL